MTKFYLKLDIYFKQKLIELKTIYLNRIHKIIIMLLMEVEAKINIHLEKNRTLHPIFFKRTYKEID